MTLPDRIADAFDDARPNRLCVAVSGGGDSMALLDLVLAVFGRSLPIEAVTLDHGLRPEARDEAALVARFCAKNGVPHSVLTWRAEGAGNLMARARDARYRLIADWARQRDIDQVALGHTADDAAETFLMRLSRAAGVDGLAAMQRLFDRHGVTWRRPLLGVSRAELRGWLDQRGIGWAEDPTNDDPAYERVRVRKLLTRLAPLGIDAGLLGRVAGQLGDARAALDHYTALEARRLVRLDRGDVLLTRAPDPDIPPEIERRLLVAALCWVSGAPYPPRDTTIRALRAALTTRGSTTAAGCHVSHLPTAPRQPAGIRITREFNAVRALTTPTEALWDGRWRLNGPHAPDLEVRALGEAVARCPAWRESGLPRASLCASPSVWRGGVLAAAPLAGLSNGWSATLAPNRHEFNSLALYR